MSNVWIGGIGEWNLGSNWSAGAAPTDDNSTLGDAVIQGSNAFCEVTSDDKADTLNVTSGTLIVQDEAELALYGNYGINENDIISNSSIMEFNNGFVALLAGGDIMNNGLIEFTNDSVMYFHASLTLQGGGAWQLSSSLLDDTDDDVLENQSNVISGDGEIETSRFVNDASGVVDASNSGGMLVIEVTSATTGAISNSGLLEATGSGELVLDADDFSVASIVNTNQILAKDSANVMLDDLVVGGSVVAQGHGLVNIAGGFTNVGAMVNASLTAENNAAVVLTSRLIDVTTVISDDAYMLLDNGTVVGGSLSTLGSSADVVVSQGVLDGSTSAGAVSLSGVVYIPYITDETLSLTLLGAIDNAGKIIVGGENGSGSLVIGGASTATATLSGGGKILLDNGDDDIVKGGASGATLVNQDNLIQGNGAIGAGDLILTNSGTLDATGASPLFLELSTSSASVNSGTIEATAGGDLEIERGQIVNSLNVFADDATVDISRSARFSNKGSLSAVDDGLVSIGSAGVNAKNFTNGSGTVSASSGGEVDIGKSATTNLANATLTGGYWISGASGDTVTSTLNFADAFTSLAAYIKVAGLGQISDGGTTLESKLTDIASGGSLVVARNYATANKLSVEGSLYLQGATFNSGLITTTGLVYGSGTLVSALNSATGVGALNGTLTLKGTATLGGAIGGLGTVAFSGDAVSLNTGAAFNAANITFAGAAVTVNANVGQAAKGLVTPSFTETLSTFAIGGGDTMSFASTALFKGGSVSGAGTLQLVGAASASFQSAAAATVAAIAETGTSSITIAEFLSYAGAYSEGTGTKLVVASGFSLTLSGGASFAGSTSGLGTLLLSGGSTTISTGAGMGVANWKLSGAATSLNIGATLSYSGAFTSIAGVTINLTGGAFALNGAAILTGTKISASSARLMFLNKTATVANLSIVGSAELESTGVTTESGGNVTVGDAVTTDKATLYNASKGVWDITDNSGVLIGADAASTLQNAGMFEKTAGAGVSAVATAVNNTGALSVAAGTLDFKAGILGTGAAAISGASTLEFDAGVAATQTISFSGSGGDLLLRAPTGFKAQISDFDAGGRSNDAITLLGGWTIGHFTENAGGTGGTLALTAGSNALTLNFLGSYQDGHFHASTASGLTALSYS